MSMANMATIAGTMFPGTIVPIQTMTRLALAILALAAAAVLLEGCGDAGRSAVEFAKFKADEAAKLSPHPDSLAGQLARPWRHVSGKMDEQKFRQDQAKCKLVAHQTPLQPAESPEIKFLTVLITCLKAEGYEPEPPAKH